MTSAELVAAAASGTRLTLREDVKNPKPDRRATRDWRCSPVITKGMKFYVVREYEGHLRVYKAGGYSHDCVMYRGDGTLLDRGTQADLSALLLPALAADKQVLGSVAAKHYRDAEGAAVTVVGALLMAGRLTHDEIDAILAKDREGED